MECSRGVEYGEFADCLGAVMEEGASVRMEEGASGAF